MVYMSLVIVIERYNMITRSNRKNSTEKTEERKNRFNGESIMLTKEESIIHDRLFINELAATLEDKAAGVDGTSKLWDKVRKDINYFRQHNALSSSVAANSKINSLS